MLCHHVIHDGQSVCVVVMDGAQYYMPTDVSADYDGTVGNASAPAVDKALTYPIAFPLGEEEASGPGGGVVMCRATSGHLLLSCHAMTLAVGQCAIKNDFSHFRQHALENASSVTPVGAHLVDAVTPRMPSQVQEHEKPSEPHRPPPLTPPHSRVSIDSSASFQLEPSNGPCEDEPSQCSFRILF